MIFVGGFGLSLNRACHLNWGKTYKGHIKSLKSNGQWKAVAK